MPQFAYTAIEPSTGEESRGCVEGETREQAVAELKTRGLALTSLVPNFSEAPRVSERVEEATVAGPAHRTPKVQAGRTWAGLVHRVRRQDVMFFTRQLAVLLKAGMPIVRALEVLARPERNPVFEPAIRNMADVIRAGGNLSDGLKKYPKIFDPLFINMVKAGEAGGVLDGVLERLARLLERTERIKGRVKAALTYPVVILLVAGGILAGLMVFVVPKFEQIFSGLLRGQPLPPLTRLVIGAGNYASHHLAVTVGLPVLGWIAWRAFRRTRTGTALMDRFLIRAPLMGDLFLKTAVARFTRTFGSLLASGVPMLDALLVTRDTGGNVHVATALTQVHDRVRAGAGVARSLEATALFPDLVTSMIEVGEETGALPAMLTRIADAYDEEVDNAVGALTSIIEPIMIVVMAIVVGLIVIALFLPIVGVIQHLQ
ncbi:MAG: type II secretion system F family protein [Opitutaceae bacterium]